MGEGGRIAAPVLNINFENLFLTARSGSRKGKGEGGEVVEDEGTRV